MSTREYAADIFSRLTDLQLERFVALFANDTCLSDNEEILKQKRKAFADPDKIVRSYPASDLEYEEIKDAYFKENCVL